jgi:hypothetical protein
MKGKSRLITSLLVITAALLCVSCGTEEPPRQAARPFHVEHVRALPSTYLAYLGMH